MAGCAPSPRAFTAAPTAAAPATQHTHHHLAIAAARQRCIRPSITTTPCSSISTSLLNTTIWTAGARIASTHGFHVPIALPSPAPANQPSSSSSTSADHSQGSRRLSGVRQKPIRFDYALGLR